MANPNRKMVTLRRIGSITPIENADRIEVAHIGGWQVVVGKGEFCEGQIVLFFEIDTFLPTGDWFGDGNKDVSPYAFLAERGVKTMVIDGSEIVGHVLKTARLRGVYSQGLIVDPQTILGVSDEEIERLYAEHADMTDVCGVWEYYKPLPPGQMGIVGRYDQFVAPRTDAERVQNVSQEVFNLIKQSDYYASVKVDGTSMTLVYDSRVGKVRLFSHNNELDCEVGIGKVSFDAAKAQGIAAFCEEHPDTTVQYELCGPKIQQDRLHLGRYRCFVFSVFDIAKRRYVSPYGFDVLAANAVPLLDVNLDEFDIVDDLIGYVDGIRGNVTKDALDEGIVFHIIGRGRFSEEDWKQAGFSIKNELGSQMQMKVISNKYLLKDK